MVGPGVAVETGPWPRQFTEQPRVDEQQEGPVDVAQAFPWRSAAHQSVDFLGSGMRLDAPDHLEHHAARNGQPESPVPQGDLSTLEARWAHVVRGLSNSHLRDDSHSQQLRPDERHGTRARSTCQEVDRCLTGYEGRQLSRGAKRRSARVGCTKRRALAPTSTVRSRGSVSVTGAPARGSAQTPGVRHHRGMTSSRLRTLRTMCPMNCHPTLCGMLVDLEDGRVLGVRGDPDNPDSQGFLCVRGQASHEIIGNPARLLHPLVRARRGHDFREAPWDEVLDLIAARMRNLGGERVGIWTGHGLAATNYGTRLSGHLARRFANLWGCQSWSGTMICWGLGAYGLGFTGILATHTKEDMPAHANLVVLWGANLASQPNTARHLTAARRRGAHVIAIDVRQTEAAAQSDETLVVRPGSDAALALAMMHVIVAEK